ncbi:MAG TPA: ABC transporter, partial [Isoptericola sp.]|nr:ABC transporter [Isoptericola sp.]
TAMRERYGMTVVLTTHYLDEADSMAERVVVIDHGEIIADAAPDALKRRYADDTLTVVVATDDGAAVRAALPDGLGDVELAAHDAGLCVRVGTAQGAETLPVVIEALRVAGIATTSASARQASLDDVFLNLTGRSLREEAAA